MVFNNKAPVVKNDCIAGLDLGSNKVCCTIAKTNDTNDLRKDNESKSVFNNSLRVLSAVQQLSKGIRNDRIVNMDALEDSILNVVHQAEQASGQNINSVYVGLPAGILRSHIIHAELDVHQHPVQESHLQKIFQMGRNQLADEDLHVIHLFALNYSLDDSEGISDPRGMIGQRLRLTMHLLTAPSRWITNLRHCLSRCQLDIADFVAGSYAAALSTAVEDEVELGVTVIDLGGGSAGVCSFIHGQPVFQGALPLGGQHITYDIARGLAISLTQAERLKILYGSLLDSAEDDKENILVTQLGDEQSSYVQHISKSFLTRIIKARTEEIFELLGKFLDYSGVDGLCRQRFVLTGGASQLQGVRELAQYYLKAPVRIGHPLRMAGTGEMLESPAFAVGAGILHYAASAIQGRHPQNMLLNNVSLWRRLCRWFQQDI